MRILGNTVAMTIRHMLRQKLLLTIASVKIMKRTRRSLLRFISYLSHFMIRMCSMTMISIEVLMANTTLNS